MRVAVVIDSFGTDKRQTFVQADHLTVMSAMPSRERGIEVAKRSVIPTGSGINIGAVGYPYNVKDPDVLKQAQRETRAVKFGNFAWKCVRDDQDELQPVHLDCEKRAYVDENGVSYPQERLLHLYFDSRKLDNETKRIAAGQERQLHPSYYDWMQRMRNNGRVVDVATNTGRDMAYCVDSVYFGQFTVSRQLHLPEFYLRTNQVVNFRQGAVDEFILNAARSRESQFEIEMAPFNCVVTSILHDDDFVYVEFTRVERSNFNTEDPDYVLTSDTRNQEFPVSTELLVNPVEDVNVGDLIDSDQVLHRFTRVASMIPCKPAYASISNVEQDLGSNAVEWLRARVVEQHQPVIKGVRATALSLLDSLPEVTNPSDFYARNRKLVQVLDVTEQATLIQQPNKFINVDLLHHQWYDKDLARYQERQRTQSAKPSGLGNMLRTAQATGSASNAPVSA